MNKENNVSEIKRRTFLNNVKLSKIKKQKFKFQS